MRLVVDTNVFVSAALVNDSWPGELVRWLGTTGGLLKSSATEQELLTVLQRPKISLKSAQFFFDNVTYLLAKADLVRICEIIVACRDPKDDKFLELAVNGHADMIVSGDPDLLVLHPFRGIPIITPAAFCRAHALSS
jgi:putative PIN family toxin of toxin-antitoxin system